MLIDTHMHTTLCGHAIGEPEEYVEEAARKGIGLITFTCHVPLEPDAIFGGPGIRMRRKQLDDYRRMVDRARECGEALGVEVLHGIEAEVFPDPEAMARMEEVLREQPFDFVLGSLHHQLEGYRDWLDGQDIFEDREIVRTYFQHLTEGIRSGLYDSIAHPDVIRIYGTVEPFPPEDYRTEIEAFLDALVENDHCMEVNTSGLIKGVFESHPAPEILDWAANRGVKLTLGSDAHAPEQVGQYFGEVRKMLMDKGFKILHYFKERKRTEVPLP